MEELNAQEISLSHQNIDSFDKILPQLLQYKNLKRLDLSENMLSELPDDLSILSNLEELNLNKNSFSNTYKIVDSLRTLPNLKVLSINLTEEEQVDYIMKWLPNLELLNGLEVERDDEEEEEESEDEQSIQDHFPEGLGSQQPAVRHENLSPSQDDIPNMEESKHSE